MADDVRDTGPVRLPPPPGVTGVVRQFPPEAPHLSSMLAATDANGSPV